MELELTDYVRKSFTVKAVELTFKNVDAVAKWCRGKVSSETTRILGGADTELPVIKLQGQGEDRGKELTVRLGYFIVESKGRFRVYKAPQFWAAFEEKFVASVSPDHTDVTGDPCKACSTLEDDPSVEGLELHSVSLVPEENALPGQEITQNVDKTIHPHGLLA